MTDDEITAKAKRDYRESGGGPGAYANQYGPGSAGFNAYERGWMQALKQDDKPSFAHEAPAPHEQFRPVVSSKPSVNLYGLAKGRSGPRDLRQDDRLQRVRSGCLRLRSLVPRSGRIWPRVQEADLGPAGCFGFGVHDNKDYVNYAIGATDSIVCL